MSEDKSRADESTLINVFAVFIKCFLRRATCKENRKRRPPPFLCFVMYFCVGNCSRKMPTVRRWQRSHGSTCLFWPCSSLPIFFCLSCPSGLRNNVAGPGDTHHMKRRKRPPSHIWPHAPRPLPFFFNVLLLRFFSSVIVSLLSRCPHLQVPVRYAFLHT